MNKILITLTILFVSMTLVSLPEAQGHHPHYINQQTKEGGYSQTTDEFQTEFTVLMKDYFGLIKALVDSDLEQAKHSSHQMGERLAKIGQHRLDGHVFWVNHSEDLSNMTFEISDAGWLSDEKEIQNPYMPNHAGLWTYREANIRMIESVNTSISIIREDSHEFP